MGFEQRVFQGFGGGMSTSCDEGSHNGLRLFYLAGDLAHSEVTEIRRKFREERPALPSVYIATPHVSEIE